MYVPAHNRLTEDACGRGGISALLPVRMQLGGALEKKACDGRGPGRGGGRKGAFDSWRAVGLGACLMLDLRALQAAQAARQGSAGRAVRSGCGGPEDPG